MVSHVTRECSLSTHRFADSPAQGDPWQPHQVDRKHVSKLMVKLDGMLSAIEGLQAAR